MSLRSLSDKALLSQTVRLTRRERETTFEILKHLVEIEWRGLHLRLGYSSLFAYCTEHLGYSRSGAGRRVAASRCIRKFPKAGQLLRCGRVNTTSLSMIAGLMTSANAESLLARIDGKSQHEVEVVAAELRPLARVRDRVKPVCVRVSTRTDGSAGASDRPGSIDLGTGPGSPGTNGVGPRSDAAGHDQSHNGTGSDPHNPELVKKMFIQFAASTEFMAKLDKVKSLLSTKLPAGVSLEQAFEATIDAFLDKHDPEARAERRSNRAARKRAQSPGNAERAGRGRTKATEATKAIRARSERSKAPGVQADPACSEGALAGSVEVTKTKDIACPTSSDSSRYIPPATRDAVFKRDQGRCAFRGATGKRCTSRHNLQIDHIVPHALGGSNSLSNLRLLCANHNRHEAERVLGQAPGRFNRRE